MIINNIEYIYKENNTGLSFNNNFIQKNIVPIYKNNKIYFTVNGDLSRVSYPYIGLLL